MSALQLLRVLVTERLSAAAEDILEAVKKTVADYEEELVLSKQEIRRQREMLHRATAERQQDPPPLALSVWEESFPSEQQQNQDHPAPPGTRKSPEELRLPQEAQDQVEVLQETEEGNAIRIILRAPYAANPPQQESANAAADPRPSTSAGPDQTGEALEESSRSPDVQHDSEEDWRGGGESDNDSDGGSSKRWKKSPEGSTAQPLKKYKSRISCQVCEKPFHAVVSLVNHLKVHPKDVCGVCGQRFDAAAAAERFDDHLKTHMNAVVCSVCGKCFGATSALETHMRVHTGEKPFHCSDCGKSFNCRHNMMRHIRIHTGEKPYICSMCGKSFNDYSTLKRHLLIHVRDDTYTQVTAPRKETSAAKAKAAAKTKAAAKARVAAAAAKHHSRTVCEVCGKMFHSMVSLVNHAKSHATELCGVCGTRFDTVESLVVHLKTHKNGKVCDVCGKCFDSQGNLEIHARIHTGEKPFLCSECGKPFNCRHNMMRHMRTHTGEKPYLCNVCGRCFSDHTSLKQHSSTHTGEKPHVCHVCGKGFHRKTYLKLHMKSHGAAT